MEVWFCVTRGLLGCREVGLALTEGRHDLQTFWWMLAIDVDGGDGWHRCLILPDSIGVDATDSVPVIASLRDEALEEV